MIYKYYLPFCGLPFHFFDSVLWCSFILKICQLLPWKPNCLAQTLSSVSNLTPFGGLFSLVLLSLICHYFIRTPLPPFQTWCLQPCPVSLCFATGKYSPWTLRVRVGIWVSPFLPSPKILSFLGSHMITSASAEWNPTRTLLKRSDGIKKQTNIQTQPECPLRFSQVREDKAIHWFNPSCFWNYKEIWPKFPIIGAESKL